MTTFGSVCSGIEAASVAWHPLGWKAAWLSEIEPFPCAVLAHHYPEVPNLGDMTTLPERVRAGEAAAPDVFTGGTPCQAFSVAGKRESLGDARGNLSLTFCEIADAIDDVRAARGDEPCVVVWENVPGVLSTADNAFGCFLGALAGAGDALQAPEERPGEPGTWGNAGLVLGPRRAVAWRTLDAQFFGLAQRRRRVFVVASARDGFDPGTVLLEFDGVRRDSAPRREAREGSAEDAGCGAAIPGGAGCWWDGGQVSQTLDAVLQKGQTMPDKNRFPAVLVPDIIGTLTSAGGHAVPGNTVQDAMAGQLIPTTAHTLRGEGENRPSRPSCVVGVPVHVDVMPTMRSGGSNGSPSHGQVSGDTRDEYILRGRDGGATAEMGDDLAFTLRASDGGGDKPHAMVPLAFLADDYKTGAFSQVDVAGPLTTTADRTRGAPIAFSSKDHGADAGELAPTLRAMGHDGSHANGGGQVAVAFGLATSVTPKFAAELSPTLTIPSPTGGGQPAAVAHGMAVRRLTPVECERLQGFPDGYTMIPTTMVTHRKSCAWHGTKVVVPDGTERLPCGCKAKFVPIERCPDGPRYKALGNSWAVPCARWIGARVDAQLRRAQALEAAA